MIACECGADSPGIDGTMFGRDYYGPGTWRGTRGLHAWPCPQHPAMRARALVAAVSELPADDPLRAAAYTYARHLTGEARLLPAAVAQYRRLFPYYG